MVGLSETRGGDGELAVAGGSVGWKGLHVIVPTGAAKLQSGDSVNAHNIHNLITENTSQARFPLWLPLYIGICSRTAPPKHPTL